MPLNSCEPRLARCILVGLSQGRGPDVVEGPEMEQERAKEGYKGGRIEDRVKIFIKMKSTSKHFPCSWRIYRTSILRPD